MTTRKLHDAVEVGLKRLEPALERINQSAQQIRRIDAQLTTVRLKALAALEQD